MIEIRCTRCQKLLCVTEDMLGVTKISRNRILGSKWFCSENCRHILIFEEDSDPGDYYVAEPADQQNPSLWWDKDKKPYVWGNWCPKNLTEEQRKKLAHKLSLADVLMIDIDEKTLESYIE